MGMGYIFFLWEAVSPIKLIICNKEPLVRFEMFLCEQSYIYVSLTELIALPPNAICIKCYDSERPMNSISHFVALN
jgi:hypothetical protein